MASCLNPDCQQPIPDDHHYCDEICLRWHIKIKRQHASLNLELKPYPDSRHQVEAILSGANHINPDCPACRKPINDVEESYYQYHGNRFCNRNCCIEYKKTEKIELENDLPFMRYVRQQQKKEVFLYVVQ